MPRQKPTTVRQLANIRLPWRKAKDMPHGKTTLVSKLVDEYLKSPKYLNLGLGTKIRYQSALRLFEHLILANSKNIFQMPAHKVDYGIVDYLHKVLTHSHKDGTIRFYFSVMSNVWETALRSGRVMINPWAKNEVKVSNHRDITWTQQEVKEVIRVAKENGHYSLALYIILCYETAQRPWQDLKNLKWENLTNDAKGNPFLDFVISKTNVHIILPLSNVAMSAIAEVAAKQPDNAQYIFSDEAGNVLTSNTIHVQFQKVKKLAMVRPELHIRDLRRTAITELAQSGATMSEITAITGWKGTESIIQRYARVRIETAINALAKRNKFRGIDENQGISTETTDTT